MTDESMADRPSSSSPGISFPLEHEDEHCSSSSKIYNDYKKRTSSVSIPTSAILSHSLIIHPMHTRIGLRSSTSSSSTNEKLPDMTLSSKQMNVCVINQLNEHLSTRFRQQQQEACSNSTNPDHESYDPPPKHLKVPEQHSSNVYAELSTLPLMNSTSSPSVPPPPPP